jgi:hypothetical protein
VHLIDETGRLVDGDQIMALIATPLGRGWRLSGGALVATVMSNLGLERRFSPEAASGWSAPRSATAMSSSACAPAASMSAASSPAMWCCRISRPPATV